MSRASQIRTKPVREQRYRDKLQFDGWRWLRRAIQTWLWHEKNLCRKALSKRNRYIANADLARAKARTHHLLNRDRHLLTMSKYRERNRDNINAANRESYAARKETRR